MLAEPGAPHRRGRGKSPGVLMTAFGDRPAAISSTSTSCSLSTKLHLDDIWPAFERKAQHKQIEPAQFAERFEKRIPQWRSRWDSEMRESHVIDQQLLVRLDAMEATPFAGQASTRRPRRSAESGNRSVGGGTWCCASNPSVWIGLRRRRSMTPDVRSSSRCCCAWIGVSSSWKLVSRSSSVS